MKKCETLWKCWGSPKIREQLQTFLGCCLKKPVATRWNSLYDSLEQVFQLKEKLMDCNILTVSTKISIFYESDFDYIAEYLSWSNPLAKAIVILQGEENCHYGYVLPTLLSIKQKWDYLTRSHQLQFYAPIVDKLKISLSSRFNDYFEIVNKGEFAAIAAITHPRFKVRWINLLNEEKQLKVKHLVDSLTNRPTPQTQERNRQEHEDFFDFGDVSNNEIINSLIPQVSEETELKKFLSDTSSNLSDSNNFPVVKKLFLKYNTALPSSAPVERFFSYLTLLDLPKNNKINDKNFEMRVVCKANYQQKFK